MKLSVQEKRFLKKINIISFDFDDEDILNVEEKVSNYLQKHGFDKNYQPTEDGLICESILDKISEI